MPNSLNRALCILVFCAASASLSGCGFPGVYKIDIQQGNVVTQEMVDQLRPGMTTRQVRFIMGTPLIQDTFEPNRWDYLYSMQSGHNPREQERISLMFENDRLVGLAGALFAQTQGGADISMGIGTIVIGLAAVIVGESILPSRRIFMLTLAVILGAVVYRFFIALALNSDFIGLEAQDLNLVTAVLVTIALVIPLFKQRLARRRSI